MKSKTKLKNNPSKAISELEMVAKTMRKAGSVLVGLPKNSNNYPDGTSVIMVGAVHEFGSPARNVPQRSFLRSTIIDEQDTYKDLFKQVTLSMVKGDIDSKKALSMIGLQVESDVKEKITNIDSPKLKNREGNPLIDTGHLRQSIIFEVIE